MHKLIVVNEETFIIDNVKTFIYGGELHYFRVPKEAWRDRIKKIKEAGCNLISTYIPWMWHEKLEGIIDLTGETTPERDVKTFLEMINEENMYCLVRPGPYVMSELKNHGIPEWINKSYPEVIAKTQNGENHVTNVVSYLHPKFIEKVDVWYDKLFKIIAPLQITRGGNIILLQLDNEVGMLQWVTNQADYNEDTLNRFGEHIKNKYTLQMLSNLLGMELQDYKKAAELIKSPNQSFAITLQNEFMLFMRKYYKEYIDTLKKISIKYGIEIPFVVNVHGFDNADYAKRGKKYPIGLSQLYECLQTNNSIAAGDYYIGNIVHENYHDIILANAFTKAVQGERQPLFSAEFQSGFQYGIPRLQPTTFDLTTRLCIANGMNALNYYMFAGGENYEDIGLLGKRHDWQAPISADGTLKQHYYKIKYLGEVISAIEKDLLESKKDVVTYIGFYADYFMTEYSNEYTKDMFDTLKIFRESYLYDGVGRGLTLNNIPYEGYNLKKNEEIPISKIKSLWMFSTPWMDEEVQDKLLRYVQNGGNLVLFPAIPRMNMKGKSCTKLLDALEVELVESFSSGYVKVDDIDSIPAGYIETYKGNNIQYFGSLQDNSDKKCAFEKKLGKGKVEVLGAGIELDQCYKDCIIKGIAAKVGNSPISSKNDYIDVSFRRIHNTDTKFMFIQNYDDYEKNMSFDYFGHTLFDGRELNISPRSGLILPLNYRLNSRIKLLYSTCEITCKKENEIEVFCRQEIETLKFDSKIEIIDLNADYELQKVGDYYKLIVKGCSNKRVKIKI